MVPTALTRSLTALCPFFLSLHVTLNFPPPAFPATLNFSRMYDVRFQKRCCSSVVNFSYRCDRDRRILFSGSIIRGKERNTMTVEHTGHTCNADLQHRIFYIFISFRKRGFKIELIQSFFSILKWQVFVLIVDNFWVQEIPDKCVRLYVDEINNLFHHVKMLGQCASRT